MSKSNIIAIIDIETVIDDELSFLNHSNSNFPAPMYWKIISIGCAVAIQNHDNIKLEHISCGTGDEKSMLNNFWDYFDRVQPKIVSFNGRCFDMPVLLHRAFKHGIATNTWHKKGERWDSYRQRFSENYHCDLMDLISGHGACTRINLDTMSKAIGFPGKIDVDGNEVKNLYDNGLVDVIKSYCEFDLINTYGLYIRWCYFSGKLTAINHDKAMTQLFQFLSEEKNKKPYFAKFIKNWDRRNLMVNDNVISIHDAQSLQ
tara:strand:- start:269 stop:1045 length:777 start_codon:yes stop_codon:yes gene_type:complete